MIEKCKQLHTCAIILSAGRGTRMGIAEKKQMLEICGSTVLQHTVSAFEKSELINSIVVVACPEDIDKIRSDMSIFEKVVAVVIGGKTRAESAKKGYLARPDAADFVAIHDGVRCIIGTDKINEVIRTAHLHGAATAGSTIFDTVKRIDAEGNILETVDRSSLFAAHTPQVFRSDIYQQALDACKDITAITDDNTLLEKIGVKIRAVDTGSDNLKITTKNDLNVAKYIISKGERMPNVRIGHGYDVHRFVSGRDLILGGVKINYERGLLGHSDADVLIHAIIDSVLGAAGLGDIGKHFPDNDPVYEGASSIALLKKVSDLLQKNGYKVSNIDATVVLERPKISVYIEQMTENICSSLGIECNRVNIKATTEEGLGFTGIGDGAAAHAVAIIEKQ